MKNTIFVKAQERFFRDSNYHPHTYIIDVAGELSADTIRDAISKAVINVVGWYIEDIKILATTP